MAHHPASVQPAVPDPAVPDPAGPRPDPGPRPDRAPRTDTGHPRPWWLALLIVGWFNLVSAVGGGLGLVVANGMGMPRRWLEGTPFDSFVIPGVILMLVVGGTQALAVLLQHRRHPWAPAAAGVAGFGMVIWVYVEVALLPVYSFLHTLYLTTGVLQLVFLLLCLGILPAGRAAARPR